MIIKTVFFLFYILFFYFSSLFFFAICCSVTYFKESGFEIEKITYDLHKEDIFEGKNIETEHEKMFSEQGIKIKALIARKI